LFLWFLIMSVEIQYAILGESTRAGNAAVAADSKYLVWAHLVNRKYEDRGVPVVVIAIARVGAALDLIVVNPRQ